MRIVHTSDWHLGHELHGFDRGIEHDTFLDWLAGQLTELEADALLVTGDVYDTVNPSIQAQRRLYQFVKSVLSQSPHLQIILIGGNHDSAARLELPKHLLDADRVHLIGGMPRAAGEPLAEPLLIPVRDPYGTARMLCAAVPYLRPGDLPLVENGESPIARLYHRVVDSAHDRRGDLPLIVTGHLHLIGGAVSVLSERRIVVGGEEAVSSEIFPGTIAYVALGHLHKPQAVSGQTIIRYAGSPFPMSVTEKDYRHSIVVIDVDQRHGVRTGLLPTPRPVPFYRVPAAGAAPLDFVEEALRRLVLEDPGESRRPFLEVAVELDGAEPELRRRINDALEGKPVRLTRVLRQTRGTGGTLADSVNDGSSLDELDPAVVFARRHHEVYAAEPPDDLRRAFNEVLNSVLAPDQTRRAEA